MQQNSIKRLALRESALLLALLFLGLVVVPGAIYLVGQKLFGEFGGQGYADFFGTLSANIRGGDLSAWFFVLSPYLAWQVMRLSLHAWRTVGRPSR